MFWKKKDPLATPKSKAPLAKKAERGFFHIFNNKSKARRVAFVGVLAWFPSYGGAIVLQEAPDTNRQPQTPAQVQQYETTIARIAQNSQNMTTLPAARIETADLVVRLVKDTGISEQDAENLARAFLRDVETDNLSPELVRMMRGVRSNAEFLADARTIIADRGGPSNDAADALDILEKAADMDDNDYWYRFFFAYVFLFPAMQSGVNNMLRRGARRDDELKQEEKREIVQDKVRDIRDMITPRSQKDPAPPAPKKP